MRKLLTGLVLVLVLGAPGALGAAAYGDHGGRDKGRVHQVTVPEADRFSPFALQIRAGDSVRWVNNDEDNHFVVSDDAFNTAGNRGTNHELTADGGSLVLHFRHPGTFVYYCRLHSH